MAKIKKNFAKLILIITFIINYISISVQPTVGQSSQFYTKEHFVIDLYTSTEWMRCSVGQRWNGETCTGKIIKLNHDQMEEVLKLASEQLGSGWRLPSRKELESLVCRLSLIHI